MNLASSSFCAILCWVFGLISWPGRMSLDFYLHLVLLWHPLKARRHLLFMRATCSFKILWVVTGGGQNVEQPRRLFGLAIFHWGGMLFSNISVSEVHISFTHTVKAMCSEGRGCSGSCGGL